MKRVLAVAVVSVLAGVTTAEAAERPKLSVVRVANPPQFALAGQPFEVSGRLRNAGDADGKARVKISLRRHANGEDVRKLGAVRLRVPAGARKSFSTKVRAPRKVGLYFVAACVKRKGKKGKVVCRSSRERVLVFTWPQVPPPPNPPNPPEQPEEPEEPGPTFEPGARTLGDPLFPQLGNGGYDALHYDIEVDYDREANEFNSARTTMTATATQNLSEFSLDFQDLPVSYVEVNGEPAAFEQVEAEPQLSSDPDHTQPMKLVVTPAEGIPEGTEFTVAVEYAGEPQVIVDPDGSSEGWIPACYRPEPTDPEVCDSAFVVGEPMGSQGWFPSNNYPSDKATFRTEITVAFGEKAFGTGELEDRVDNPDGTTTWTWVEDDPTAPYLVTATNGVFGYAAVSANETLTGRTLPVHVGYDPSATDAQLENLWLYVASNGSLIDFFGERFGPYPFDSYGAIFDRAPDIGYALEVQTKSHFASLNTAANTYVHELAHQWFGNAVTLERWNDIWFNEGWARFSEWLYAYESGATATTPEEQFSSRYNNPNFDWSIAPAVLDGDPANLFEVTPTYTRGGMVIEGYREIVGDARFYDFAKAIQQQFAHDNISTQEFVALALEMSGFEGEDLELLEEYFQQWLFGVEKPTVSPESFS